MPGQPVHSDGHSEDGEPTAIHALVSGLIDYAGLYPPAKLDMKRAVANYAAYLRSPDSWMLGRFIVPVSRLEEFRRDSAGLLPSRPGDEHADQPWPISAIIDGDVDENIDSIFAFNHEHQNPRNGLAVIDAIEIKVPVEATGDAPAPPAPADFIDDTLDLVPEELYPFFEIPVMPAALGSPAPDVRGMVAALAGADAAAKVRTGGVTPGSFPTPDQVAEFIFACAAADVPFKATAGLHHACRGSSYPFTYEADSPKGPMHGFLNVFVCAALIAARRIDTPTAVRLLEETDAAKFQIGRDVANWEAWGLDTLAIATARETFALSYGSCSFEEPVQELRRLGLV